MGATRRWRTELRRHGDPLAGPLGRRLLGWLLLFSLLPLFLTNAVGYLRSQWIIEDLVRRYLEAIAEVEARHIQGEVARHRLDLEMIAAGNEFLAAGATRLAGRSVGPMGAVADRGAVLRHLQRKRDELGEFEELLLQLPSGKTVSTAAGTDTGEPVTGVGGPATAASTPFERVAADSVGGPPRFRLSVPVVSGDGDTVAYLTAVIGPDGIRRFLEIPEHLAGSVESFIVDAAGRPVFVSHPHEPVDWRRPLATPLVSAPPGRLARYRDREGVEVIGFSADVPGLPWRYIAEAPVSATLGPLRQLRRLSLLFGTAFAVLLTIMAWVVASGIVAPVRRLVSATRGVAAGDLSVRVEAGSHDEIGELGQAFNDMAGELAETSARVRELHQREISRAQQLATVGELASGVAHEIKNPVIGIASGLDLVKRRLGEDPALSPIMEEMTTQIGRIENAIRELLAFARPATPALADSDVNGIVARAARLVEPAADQADVRIRLDPDPGLPTVPVDRELMNQALVNLLMNAVQATPPGGVVAARTERRGEELALAISDTGRGIAAGDLEHIFKPFFTTRHAGTGLGLSITREIIERHGGRVEVVSRLGRGSTFTILLPLRASNAPRNGDEGVV